MARPVRRIVLDTSVIVAGLRSRQGAGYAILGLVERRILVPLITTALCNEYEAVLSRPEQVAAHGLSAEDINKFLNGFVARAQPVHIAFRWRPQLADPDDEIILDASVNGDADAVVTYNVRHLAPISARFGIPVLRPDEVLRSSFS